MTMTGDAADAIGELRLRRGEASDAALMTALLAEPEVYEFIGDGHPVPVKVVGEWIGLSDAAFAAHGVGLWFLEVDGAADGSFVGLYPNDGTAELVFALHPRLWGRGLASRMAMTAIDRGFAAGFATIWAGVDGGNSRSEAALVRIGLRRTGSVEFPLGPGARYEIGRGEWNAGQMDLIPVE